MRKHIDRKPIDVPLERQLSRIGKAVLARREMIKDRIDFERQIGQITKATVERLVDRPDLTSQMVRLYEDLRKEGYIPYDEFVSSLRDIPFQKAQDLVNSSVYIVTGIGTYVLPPQPTRLESIVA